MKAIFLDMDHTVIRPKSGARFPKDKDDWEFIPGVADAIKGFVKNGYMPIIVTNQGGIQAGFQTEPETIEKLEDVTKQLAKFLNISKVPYYYSKTTDKKDPMRKPNKGMAVQALGDHGLDLSQSIMVGDMESDREFAVNSEISKFIWAHDLLKQH